MKHLKIIHVFAALFLLTGCQTMEAYQCALGGCAVTNAQKRDLLQNEQQKNKVLRVDHIDLQKKQRAVRTELTSMQEEYKALSHTIGDLQKKLRKAGQDNSTVATKLSSLQNDIELRESTSVLSTSAIQKEQLKELRKRKDALQKQVKILLAD